LRREESRRGGVAPLGDALAGFLRGAHLDERMRERAVFGAWRAALGPALAERAVAVRFQRGELTVEVAGAALLGELMSFTGERHRRDANARLGGNRIQSICFKPRR
jgi:hypothetical protein